MSTQTRDPHAPGCGDEALRAAALTLVAAWEAEEQAIREFVATDSTTRIEWTHKEQLVKKAEAALRAALATPSSAPDHREGRDPGNDGWAGSGRCARCGEPWPCPSSAPAVEGLDVERLARALHKELCNDGPTGSPCPIDHKQGQAIAREYAALRDSRS